MGVLSRFCGGWIGGIGGIGVNEKVYEFDAVIQASEIGRGGAFVVFPWDVRAEFGRGRVKVSATFDGEPYEGSVVNMGLRGADGRVCWVLGVLKAIRERIGKGVGDSVAVVVRERA